MKLEKESYIGGLAGSPVKKFFSLLGLERKDVVLVYTYAIISGMLSLSLPLGVQSIMSIVKAAQLSTSLIVLIVLVLLGILATSGMQIMQYRIIERLQQRLFAKVSLELAAMIPQMKVESLLKKYAPELMNRFFDIMTVQKGLPKIIVDLSASLLQIVFSLLLLSFYSAFFAFYGLFVVFIIVLLFYWTSEKGLKTSLKESSYKYEVASWLEELSSAMNIFKLAGYTDMPQMHTDKLVSKYLKARQSHFKILIQQYSFVILFKVLITGGLLIIGTGLVISQQINIGEFVASEIIIILLLNAAEKMFSGIETVYDVLTGLEKISVVTSMEIENDEGIDFEDVDNGKGVHFEFKNVSYSYPQNNHQAIKNLDLDIESGQKVCIVGYAASGASTLINLSASLLHNYEGTILVNGVSLRNLNLLSLRSYVGENLANNEIMDGTIAENISMGRDDISFKDVLESSEIVGLKSFVQNLPLGFGTPVIANDMTMPASVIAKINIARSVAERPRLFLMDQPFESLDKKDKTVIAKHLANKEKDWTLIVSTNDVSMAEQCDKVVVLKDGMKLDEGTFNEISEKPYFKDLFDL